MSYEHLNKVVVKDLKKLVQDISLKSPSREEIIRHLKELYIKTLNMKTIPYEYYLEATAYLVVLRSL